MQIYVPLVDLIKGDEYKDWRFSMEEYLQRIKATGDEALLLELNTLAMRKRINRLEALEAEILAHSAILADVENENIGDFLEKGLTDSYYKGMYDEYLQKDPKTLDLMANNHIKLSKDRVNKVLTLPWSGDNYLSNIWKNSYFIAKKTQSLVAKNIIAGKSIDSLTKEFTKVYGDTYRSNVRRLLRTETAYVKSQADVEMYKTLEVEEYEILATLDSRTSEICQGKDGLHYKVDEIAVGINYPPFHPNCRTTTIKYREERGDSTRIAKDKDGNNVKVPLGMRYEDWRRWIDGKGFIVVNELNTWVHDDIEYKVDGHHVILDYSKHEKEIAEILSNHLKKEIRLVPKVVYPQDISTPDYLIEGERWDLKDIFGNSKSTIDNAVLNKKKQANNFVFDISKTDLTFDEVDEQINKLYLSERRKWIDGIKLVQNDKVIKEYYRKK